MSAILDVADAVVNELNMAEPDIFSVDFTASRKVLPAYELAELVELKVTVVPKRVEIIGSTRSVSQYDLAVDIGIQKKHGKDLDAEIVALSTLVDEIADYLRGLPLGDAPWAAWVHTANDPVYAPEHLAEQRVFTSVLTVTYRAMK